MTTLTFTGDIFPGDEMFTKGFGIKSKTNECIRQIWERDISEVVGKANYVIGNLEGPLVCEDNRQHDTFYGHPMFADILFKSGVNVLNIANNHIMEHGELGFRSTIETLRKNGIIAVGEAREGLPVITTFQHEGIRFAMAGFCDERVCSVVNSGCYAKIDEQTVMQTLLRMKNNGANVIIFIFHWGNEYITLPSMEQRQLAYKLIDSGATLVVGHHPHVIQPYEKYNGGHIIYSLGNFCFDDVQSSQFGKGMVANVTFNGSKVEKVELKGVDVQDMAYSDHLVKPMPLRKFRSYFEGINNTYVCTASLSSSDYCRLYTKRMHRNHTHERIMMRLSIIKHLLHPCHHHRKELLSNIIRFIRK